MIEKAAVNNKEINKSVRYIRSICDLKPKVALVLGSGLGNFAARIDIISSLSSTEIPFYPVSSVPSHAGKLIFGFLQNDSVRSHPILVFQGRVHFYETGSFERIAFPIMLAHNLGIKKLIITNAAGGINSQFKTGDLMLIHDFINLTITRHSIIKKNKSRESFDYFDGRMQQAVIECASKLRIPLQHGTYCWLKGPSYETPAEIKMLKRIGVDAVGMSAFPEVVTAYNLGMKIVGISLISNLASGMTSGSLKHTDVTKIAGLANDRFSAFIDEIIFSIN